MSQFGARNQPWARGAGAAQLNSQLAALGGLAGMGGQLTMQQGMSLGGQLGGAALGLGTLGGQMMLNAAAFAQPQQLHVSYGAVPTRQVQAAQVNSAGGGMGNVGGGGQKNQRAFIGVVTKMHDNYGFVDDDVFFQTTVVKGPLPRVGERVMVEASYNANMPFKWNASRIQVLPNQDERPGVPPPQSGPMRGMQRDDLPPRGGPGMGGNSYQRGENRDDYYRGGPPPVARRSPPIRRPSPPPRRRSPSPPQQRYDRGVKRERERSPLRPPRESPRRSESRVTEKSGRKTSASPPRRRAKVQPRYAVKVPSAVLNIKDANVAVVRHRFSNMYIPSDFFHAMFNCVDSFPVYRPLSIQHEAAFHIMHRDVDPPVANNAIWDPPDVDYRYSAKVMLLSMSPTQDFLKKTLCMQPDGTTDFESTDYDPSPINKEVSFLIGLKGRSEYLAIGGPWSPSLDGADPENDPRVLVKTAIRTCKALTGIDLSRCTQWYKFVELRYRRCDKEKPGDDARVETVVVFVPDVWTLMPTQAEFDAICSTMKEQLASKLAELDAQAAADEEQEKQQQQAGGKIQDKDSSATAVPMDTSTTMTKPEVEQA